MYAVPNTITSALTICVALDDTSNIIFNVSNASDRISNEVFNNNFNTCIDLKFSDFDKHWKTYGSLTVAKVRIIDRPSTKVNIRDFFHWVMGRIGISEYPTAKPFPIG